MGRVLMMWERKIFRIIYGPTYENGHWRIKINQEMYSNNKSPDILSVIKVCMLEWLGHVRTDDTRAVKELLAGKLGGRRKKRKIWFKVV
jgi:hypothetical protein